MKYIELNNTKIVFENKKGTPRAAVYLYFKTPSKNFKEGANIIFGNLLLQGTDNKTGEMIADELERLGIEVYIDSSVDYLKISIVALNEDIETALDIVNDIILNSNFKTFDKEIFKFKGETTALLDSPVSKAADAFYRELFLGHIYGATNSKLLETIDELTFNDIVDYHKNIIQNSVKIISAAASAEDEQKFLNMLTEKLSCMKNSLENFKTEDANLITGTNTVKTEKNDAKQAQIFEGWIVPSFLSDEYPKFCVLNNVLGASGLSSRLFVELRDKKGLAYTVRSSYKTLLTSACFYLYIGTNPSNIEKSLAGFKYEIQRIIKEPPSLEELNGAIENYIGKFKYFYTQTNAQIASLNGWNYISGAGFDYHIKTIEKIKKVTAEDLIQTTQKYLLSDPVVSILAPKTYF